MTSFTTSRLFSVSRKWLAIAAVTVPALAAITSQGQAQTLGYASQNPFWSDERALPTPSDRMIEEPSETARDSRLERQVVSFVTREAPGTIVIDTPNTYLYYVLGNNRALRYGVGVGREGFTWAGVQQVSRKAEWPDWHPPADMIARQPYLPRFMAGGAGNPLGARAMYLGSSIYRIHGTNDPSTIGKFVSSGCIRLTNDDVADLFNRVTVGTKVIVMPKTAPSTEARRSSPATVSAARPDVRPVSLQRQALNLSTGGVY